MTESRAASGLPRGCNDVEFSTQKILESMMAANERQWKALRVESRRS